jgi:hypothetical protein
MHYYYYYYYYYYSVVVLFIQTTPSEQDIPFHYYIIYKTEYLGVGSSST